MILLWHIIGIQFWIIKLWDLMWKEVSDLDAQSMKRHCFVMYLYLCICAPLVFRFHFYGMPIRGWKLAIQSCYPHFISLSNCSNLCASTFEDLLVSLTYFQFINSPGVVSQEIYGTGKLNRDGWIKLMCSVMGHHLNACFSVHFAMINSPLYYWIFLDIHGLL